ncbi:MAG: four helix bundle protein [Patescibacteria group bacterium]|nr:four helix bundle protein [Patescibacteria group bacterium]
MQKFDLEDRTLEFARRVIRLCKSMPFNTINDQIIKQLIRSSGSIGANYREANDCLGDKDFIFRFKISRKEIKETVYWLELLKEANSSRAGEVEVEIVEAMEMKKIFSVIIHKLETKKH